MAARPLGSDAAFYAALDSAEQALAPSAGHHVVMPCLASAQRLEAMAHQRLLHHPTKSSMPGSELTFADFSVYPPSVDAVKPVSGSFRPCPRRAEEHLTGACPSGAWRQGGWRDPKKGQRRAS